MKKIFLFLCSLSTSVIASESILRELPCVSGPGYDVACKLKNPEDLVYFPPSNEIIFSQLGDMYSDASHPLGALEPDSLLVRELSPVVKLGNGDRWGAKNCKAVNAINAHGLDISQRIDGRWQLLVVNHYLRESIEFYELVLVGGKVDLVWRGCVEGNTYSSFNDVVALPSGGFLVSQMMPHRDTWSGKFALIKLFLGWDTGEIQRWIPGGELQSLPGSSVSLANGINLSADAKSVYLNSYGADEVVEYELESGDQRRVLAISQPDNNSWDSQGRLLIASHHGSFSDAINCSKPQVNKNCLIPFSIVAFQPETGEAEEVFSHQSLIFPVATSALEVGDDLFLGTYSGDRIVKLINYRVGLQGQ